MVKSEKHLKIQHLELIPNPMSSCGDVGISHGPFEIFHNGFKINLFVLDTNKLRFAIFIHKFYNATQCINEASSLENFI